MSDRARETVRGERRFRVQRGEIVDAGSWVYLWLEPADAPRVVYVGATGVPPGLRTWLHLHHEDPHVGRVKDRYPPIFSGQATVMAFRLDETADRQEVKRAVIERITSEGLRSDEYFGEDGGNDPVSQQARDAATAIVQRLTRER